MTTTICRLIVTNSPMSRPIFLARAVDRSDLFAHRISDVRYFLPLQSRFEKKLFAESPCRSMLENSAQPRLRAISCQEVRYYRLPLPRPTLAYRGTRVQRDEARRWIVVFDDRSVARNPRASVYYSRIDHERGRYRNRRRSILRVSRG